MKVNEIKYPLLSRLKKNYKSMQRNMVNLKKINICCYNINNISKKPFLQYLLFKDNDKFSFPWINYNGKSKSNIFQLCLSKLNEIFKNKKTSFNNKGFIYENDMIYVFFEIKIDLDIHLIKEKDLLIFTTIYEIINERKVLYYNINESVYEFFIENPDSLFLYENELLVETPCIFYNGCESRKVDYYKFYNITKSGFYGVFGPFYYFTDILGSLKWGGWLQSKEYIKILPDNIVDKKNLKFKNGSILRCVVFLEDLLIKPNKDIDHSDNTKYLTEQKKNNYSKYESDRNFNWIENYDSILLNDKNKNLILAVKSLEYVKILTYHNLDMKSLPNNYSTNISSFKIL